MNNLDKLIGELNKKYKSEIIRKGTSAVYVEKIPFTSPRANYMTYGGVPIGKATELLGQESGGKTTTALDIVKNAQKYALNQFESKVSSLQLKQEELQRSESKAAAKELPKVQSELTELSEKGPRRVVYVDAENTLDEEWAQLLGVDTDSLILVKPEDQTAEQVLQMILDLIESGEVILLVLDSLPMLVGQNLYEEDLSKKSYGGIAAAVTEFSRKVSPLISRLKTALVIINQVREDMNNPWNLYNTPGGRALKHLYALRLFFRRGSFIDDNNGELKNSAAEPKGNIVDITIVKTKVCKPDRRVGSYTLKYHEGIDVIADTFDMALYYNFVHQSGAWFYLMNPDTGEILKDVSENDLKFQGKANLLEFLREDEITFEELYNAVDTKLRES